MQASTNLEHDELVVVSECILISSIPLILLGACPPKILDCIPL